LIEKILILGEKGFVGSNLIYLFRNQGYNVSVLSRLEFSDPKKVLNTFEAADVILNCIGSANVGHSFSNTTDDFDSNVGVVRKAIEILRENNFNHIRFINLSSAAVYGNPKQLPINESIPIQPISPYGFHKSMAEWLRKEYTQYFDLKTLSLRIFVAYGNDQTNVHSNLCAKIQKPNNEIFLFGMGNEWRDFIYNGDIAQQILLDIDNANFNGEVY
jgi:UDP-glucose 4-epimerase